MAVSVRTIRALCAAILLACLACSGGGAGGSGPDPGPTGGGAGGAGDAEPTERMRQLVDEVVAIAEDCACPRFGETLRGWTDEHAGEITAVLAELGDADPDDEEIAELRAYVDTRILVITEAAADCGTEDAWSAWEHLEQTVYEAEP